MPNNKLTEEVKALIQSSVKSLKAVLKNNDVMVKASLLEQNFIDATLASVKDKKFKTTSETTDNNSVPKYNSTADLLTIAYKQFGAGDKANGLKTACLAFAAEDSAELFDTLTKINEEASQEKTDNEENQNEEEKIIASLVTESADDDDDDSEDDGDDDGYDNEEDDLTDDDDNDDDDDDNDDDDDDNDDDDDDNDDDDDDNDDDNQTVASTKPEVKNMVQIIAQLKDHPEIIASANKLAMSKQKDAKEKAENFLIASANKLKKAS